MYVSFFKPIFDRVLAAGLILLLAPILLTVSILVILKMGGPVFFVQTRIGLRKKPFNIVKFRTMRDADPTAPSQSSATRITKLGRFLRNYSLDELPQLYNILVGDLSFVGPRPLLPDYLELYSKKQLRRHDVKPGLTGWAQVNGRSSLSWAEKFRLDVFYVDNLGFLLDMRIFIKTIVVVLTRVGTTAGKSEIQERFNGKN